MSQTLWNSYIYMYLCCAISLTISTILTFTYVLKKSKSEFAYTLLTFSACLALHDYCRFIEWHNVG